MSVEIEVTHKFDGPATALLEKLVTALGAPSTTVTDRIGDLSHSETTRPGPPDPDPAPITPVRERGKPSPGKRRRTKAEVAEDEAADREDLAAANNDAESHSMIGQRAKDDAAAASKGPNIETTRDRIRAYHKSEGPQAVKVIFDGLSGGSIQTIKGGSEELAIIVERVDAAEAVVEAAARAAAAEAAGTPAGSTAGSFD
jgi:hypothetical protein